MWQRGMLTSCTLTYMTNASRGTKHEKKRGGIIESEGKHGGISGARRGARSWKNNI